MQMIAHRRYLTLLATVLIMVSVITNSYLSFATSSELNQQIIAVGCDYDTYDTGKGRVHSVACPFFAPVISSYERLLSGGFMAYGAYDAIHTDTDPVTGQHRLSITFAGRVFTLGVDPELSVDGNAWELDLSNWKNDDPFSPGKGSSNGTSVTPLVSRVVSVMQPNGLGDRSSLSGQATITTPNFPNESKVSPNDGSPRVAEVCKQPRQSNLYKYLSMILLALVLLETILLLYMVRKRRE